MLIFLSGEAVKKILGFWFCLFGFFFFVPCYDYQLLYFACVFEV